MAERQLPKLNVAGSSPVYRSSVGDPSARLKNGDRLPRSPFSRSIAPGLLRFPCGPLRRARPGESEENSTGAALCKLPAGPGLSFVRKRLSDQRYFDMILLVFYVFPISVF